MDRLTQTAHEWMLGSAHPQALPFRKLYVDHDPRSGTTGGPREELRAPDPRRMGAPTPDDGARDGEAPSGVPGPLTPRSRRTIRVPDRHT